jgi:hypothetical protein
MEEWIGEYEIDVPVGIGEARRDHRYGGDCELQAQGAPVVAGAA